MNSHNGGVYSGFPSNIWKEIAGFLDDEALNKVFPAKKTQEMGGKAVKVVEQEAGQRSRDGDELGMESGREVAVEVEDESEAQLRKELGAWREDMAGTPEEYWKKLEEYWWVNEGVPMDSYGVPRTDLLVEKAKRILKGELPELDEAGLQARAELAAKVALEGLAANEAEMLKQAKINHKGERKLKKGWDVALLHQAYHVMQGDLSEVYRDGELAKAEADSDGLSESEGVAWWARSVPEGEERTRRSEIKEEYDQKHKKAEVAVVSQGEVVRLGPDEVEVIEPDRVVTSDTLKEWQNEQKELPSVPEETSLAVVEKGDGPGVEEVDVEEGLADTVSMTTRLIRTLEQKVAVLEDHEPLKNQLMQEIVELKTKLIETQALFGKAKALIDQREQQRAAGLGPDSVEEIESDNLAYGSLVLEDLYARGLLDRNDPLDAQLGLIESMPGEVAKKLQEVIVQVSELEELLKGIPFATVVLKKRWQNEQMEEGERSLNEVVTEFPSDDDLRQVDEERGQAS